MWDPLEAVGNAAYDSYQSLTGGETQSQQQGQDEAAAAREQAHQEQAALDRQQHGIDVEAYDPPSITQHDNWDSWSHERLYGFRDTLKVEDVTAKGRAVEELGADLAELFGDMEAGARKAAGDGWQGQGAEAAVSAARPVQDWGTRFGDAMRMTGLKVQETATTAEQTKASIQPPPEFSTTREVLGSVAHYATSGAYNDAALREQERQEATKAARAVAKNVYTPGYNSVDSSTPALPPAVNPVNPPPPPPGAGTPTGPGGTGGNVGTYGGGSYGGSGSGGGFGGSGAGGSGPNAPGSNAPGTPGNYGPGTPGGNGPRPPAGNDSAWANPPQQPPGANTPPHPGLTPNAPGTPGGSGAGYGAVAGGAPGTGGRAGGGGATGRGASGGPGPGGRSGSGTAGRGSGAAPTAPTSGTSNTSGRGGRMPMGAMGGQNQGGGDEEEHERPSWLQEWDDVWLNDMPRTAPPVIE